MNSHDMQRIELTIQTLKFIAQGGEVQQVDHTANHSYKQPVKRTRKDQINCWRNRTLAKK